MHSLLSKEIVAVHIPISRMLMHWVIETRANTCRRLIFSRCENFHYILHQSLIYAMLLVSLIAMHYLKPNVTNLHITFEILQITQRCTNSKPRAHMRTRRLWIRTVFKRQNSESRSCNHSGRKLMILSGNLAEICEIYGEHKTSEIITHKYRKIWVILKERT